MVSIVIPVFNKLEYTRQCLQALDRHTSGNNYEVIVVDNNSTDGTPDFLSGVAGHLKIIRNQKNEGFTVACNQGARAAQGNYIVFLNNDTEPQPGWLDALIETMERDASIGLAGSKLIYPDGRLQEAGGIVFNDGSGWNYGRFDDPEHPRYNYVREVDYVSGASLLIRHTLLEELGYFDELYSPGYYEDTDLCFQARAAGYKVVYCPFSRVIHHEGISSGTNLSQGMKKYQVINQEKFVAKWQEVLKEQSCPDPSQVIRASQRNALTNVLIIDPSLPLFDRASGSLRLFQIIGLLRKGGHHVTYIARNGVGQETYVRHLQKMGVEVYATDPEMMRRLGYEVPGRKIDLREILTARPYQSAILSFYDIAIQYLPLIRQFSPQTKIVVDTVDIHFLREVRLAELKQDQNLQQKAEETQKAELGIYGQADAIITVTEKDWEAVETYLPGQPHAVIPNIHAISKDTPPFHDRQGLLFVGNFNHTPNDDAVRFFLEDIFPLVKQKLPEITLTIVGNNPPEDLQKLNIPGLEVAGYVPSTLPYLQKARVAVVPLRYGAGMKGKVGEALAHGLPVVSTTIGAEGMELKHGENVLIADTPGEFASQIAALYGRQTLWEQLSVRGKETVQEKWSPERVYDILEATLRAVAESKPGVSRKRVGETVKSERPIVGLPGKAKALSSIIIPAKDNWEYTRLCLDSLVRYADVPYELIIVDNGSLAALEDPLKNWKTKNKETRLKYIRSNKNLGFAGGCNRGLQVAAGDFIFILNNDTVITPRFFSTLLKPLKGSAEVGITGPVSNFVAGAQQIAADKLRYNNPDEADIEKIAGYANKICKKFKGRVTPTTNLVGLCLAMKKEVIQRIGGFDERFYPGNFEDVDFCVRALLQGFKLMICQDAFLYHFGNRTFHSGKEDYRQCLEENLAKFLKKWDLNEVKSEKDLIDIPLGNRHYPQELLFSPISRESQAYLYGANGNFEFMGEVLKTYLGNPYMWPSRLIIPCNGEEPAGVQKKIEGLMEEKSLKDNGEIVIFSGKLQELQEGLEGERCLIYSWDTGESRISAPEDCKFIL